MRQRGTAISPWNGRASLRGFNRSPRPAPSAVPPSKANGTSDPSSRASASRSGVPSLIPYSPLKPAIAAAASALPPPRPAPNGMRLISVNRAPPSSPQRRESSRAAGERPGRFGSFGGREPVRRNPSFEVQDHHHRDQVEQYAARQRAIGEQHLGRVFRAFRDAHQEQVAKDPVGHERHGVKQGLG